MSGVGCRVHAWKSCRHTKDDDLAALFVVGRGDVPPVQMNGASVTAARD
jgi:hypothetical protein